MFTWFHHTSPLISAPAAKVTTQLIRGPLGQMRGSNRLGADVNVRAMGAVRRFDG
ncbi:hypothetical protein [Streptomyces sp. NPDC057072]|uniref:hypothetical protein n=1 Tax=Streptomyces sp. NPDC057072 TaxID=3346014 RepID=UPI00362B6E18